MHIYFVYEYIAYYRIYTFTSNTFTFIYVYFKRIYLSMDMLQVIDSEALKRPNYTSFKTGAHKLRDPPPPRKAPVFTSCNIYIVPYSRLLFFGCHSICLSRVKLLPTCFKLHPLFLFGNYTTYSSLSLSLFRVKEKVRAGSVANDYRPLLPCSYGFYL